MQGPLNILNLIFKQIPQKLINISLGIQQNTMENSIVFLSNEIDIFLVKCGVTILVKYPENSIPLLGLEV